MTTDAESVSETPDNSETPLRELQLQLAILAYLSTATKARYDELRAEFGRRTDAGQSFHPAIDTGDDLDVGKVEVASISHARDSKMLTVVDQRAFSEWLLAEYPAEAEVKASKPFWFRLRDLAKTAGGRVCGPQGESEIPGLAMVLRDGAVSVRPVADMMPTLYSQMRDQLPTMLEGSDR